MPRTEEPSSRYPRGVDFDSATDENSPFTEGYAELKMWSQEEAEVEEDSNVIYRGIGAFDVHGHGWMEDEKYILPMERGNPRGFMININENYDDLPEGVRELFNKVRYRDWWAMKYKGTRVTTGGGVPVWDTDYFSDSWDGKILFKLLDHVGSMVIVEWSYERDYESWHTEQQAVQADLAYERYREERMGL